MRSGKLQDAVEMPELLGIKDSAISHFHYQLHDLNIENLDIFLRLLLEHPSVLNSVNHIKPLNCSSKDRMLIIKPRLPAVSFLEKEQGVQKLTAFSVVMKN